MQNPIEFFEKGFTLEDPEILLSWNTPLDEIAKISEGIWNGDRYVWPKCKFLNELEYPLMSEVGIGQQDPFIEITAMIGLTPDGLWDDALSLKGYDEMLVHLTALFGDPSENVVLEPDGEKYASWTFGKVEVRLSVFEQFAFRCHLSVRVEDEV